MNFGHRLLKPRIPGVTAHMKSLFAIANTAALLLIALSGHAQPSALDRLKDYVEVDTTNPPGNESRGVEFFSAIFDTAGIEYETAESAPGRGNIWARLEGGDEPALVLLHHMDVVPATPQMWGTPPLQAVVRNGFLHGRGVLDMKGLGIMHLETFLALHASGRRLNRDVIFMATADEEAGGFFGAGWLAENRAEIFDGVGFLLNEGGWGNLTGDEVWFEVEIAQKRPYWLRLTATDQPGHGSRPLTTSAPTRLIAALNRIYTSPFEPHISDSVREMMQRIASLQEPEWQDLLRDIDAAIEDPEFLSRLQAEKPSLHALIRNTCSITMLTGSQKINVVPPTSSAELDCRILPDQDADEFLEEMRALVDDDQIEIEEIMLFSAAESSADTGLFSLIEEVTLQHYPGASVVPAVLTGFTDSHFFRDMGIVSYGFDPSVSSETVISSIHGNNERIDIESFNRGVQIMIDIVTAFTR
jgi:acetylornithine deacetylase/succinyl-diaminopimelate desuccinylase-like protein